MVWLRDFPKQEEYNLKYLQSKHLAFLIKNKKDLQKNIENLKSNKNNFTKNHTTKNSLNNIVSHILSQDSANYNNISPNNINYNLVNKVIKRLLKSHKNLSKIS